MTDRARVDGLAAALAAVSPALGYGVPELGYGVPEHRYGVPALHVREGLVRCTGPDGRIPDEGVGADAVIEELVRIAAAGLPMGAGFCGWVASAPTVVPVVAQLVASVAAPQRWWVHAGNALEQVAIGWIGELLGAPWPGAFVSGGAIGNLVALAAARQRAGVRRGIDVAADGVAALGPLRVYASQDAHHVIGRACGLLGLGRVALRRIARMDPAAVERAIVEDVAAGAAPMAIVATLGDASTGAIDPIGALAEVAARHGTWLHIDGAYGGFGVLDERVRARTGDLGVADSIAVDPHKWLAVPTGTGAVLVKDKAALEGALAVEAAPYLRLVRRGDGPPASPFDELGEGSPAHTPEHSAPSRGLVVWAALRELGRAGLAERVTRHLDCARRVAERVRAEPTLELLAEPALSICCFRVRPPGEKRSGEIDRANDAIAREVRARGAVVLSTTRTGGKLALRPCFLGARTGLAEADLVVDEVLAATRTYRRDPA